MQFSVMIMPFFKRRRCHTLSMASRHRVSFESVGQQKQTEPDLGCSGEHGILPVIYFIILELATPKRCNTLLALRGQKLFSSRVIGQQKCERDNELVAILGYIVVKAGLGAGASSRII